jgi:uncharacterized protein YggE
MEIYTKGTGKNTVKPDLVTLNIKFFVKNNTYSEVLAKGTKNVEHFVKKLLPKFGFEESDLKTSSFIIKEETRWDNVKEGHVFDGFSFSQITTLEFDYDIDRLAQIMESISEFDDSPRYVINFGIKDDKKYREDLHVKAYQDAESTARAIAIAAGKELRECAQVNSAGLRRTFLSNSLLDSDNFILEESSTAGSVSDSISDSFTPEDIEISETLDCKWVAE